MTVKRHPHRWSATILRLSVLACMIAFVVSPIAFRHTAVAAPAAVQLAPSIDEPSNAGTNEPTYEVFYSNTLTVSYEGGGACLSASASSCSPLATDDALRVTVNGQSLYYESYTHDYGPVNVSEYMNLGSNTIQVELIDLMGPRRGGSAVWLVMGSGGGGSVVAVSVERSGNFSSPDGQGGTIEIEGQPRAIVPYRVSVTKNGTQAAGAELRLVSPFSAYAGYTDNNGTAEGSIAVAVPPQLGDVHIEVEAAIDGTTASSGPILLYHVDGLYDESWTLTEDEARTWGDKLFWQYAIEPSFPMPDIPVLGAIIPGDLIDLLITWLKWRADMAQYSPQAGDQVSILVFKFSAPGMTTAYLYRESVVRSGETIYEHNYFTTSYALLEPIITQLRLKRHGISVVIASPATLYMTNSAGESAGIDPVTGSRVFDFRMALSQVGDEPFRAFVPGASTGEYLLQVVGTDYGPYTLTVYSLDDNGIATPAIEVTALTEPGYITEFKIDYDPESPDPVTLTVVGTVDLKPNALNTRSRSSQNAVTAYIELPLGFDVANISVASVKLEDVVPAQEHPTTVDDENTNGIPDLMVKFDRQTVIEYLGDAPQGTVTLTVSGTYIAPVLFTTEDTMNILSKR